MVFGFGPLLVFCVFGIPVVWLPVYLSVYDQLFAVDLMLVLVFYGLINMVLIWLLRCGLSLFD